MIICIYSIYLRFMIAEKEDTDDYKMKICGNFF